MASITLITCSLFFSHLELPERAQLRRLALRLHQDGIGPLLKSPLRRLLTPAWRILVWRGGRLLSAPLRRLLASGVSVTDSQLNLPDYSNYVALKKLGDDDRVSYHHIPF